MDAPGCTSCAHYFGYMESICLRPVAAPYNPVSGKRTEALWADARNERKEGKTFWTRRERCGPSAQFFKLSPTISTTQHTQGEG
jgi:hypothetical protein